MNQETYLYESDLDDESIVLYKGSVCWTEQIETVQGYLHAADIIINYLKAEHDQYGKTSTTHDELALPLLNLYIHSIEISLKLILHRLKEHASNNCCGFKLKIDDSTLNKSLLTHDLDKITNTLDTIMPGHGEFHNFIFYQMIKDCALELYNRGVTSENTRYSLNKDSKSTKLRQNRVNIRIFKVHEDVKKYCNEVIEYIDKTTDTHLNQCEQQEFTTQRLDELRKCELALLKYEKLFADANNSRPEIKTSLPFGIIKISDISLVDLKHTEEETLLWKTLDGLPKEELAYILCGLCFIRSVVTIQSPQRSMAVKEKRELVEKIFGLKHIYNSALVKLKEHKLKVEEKIEQIIKT